MEFGYIKCLHPSWHLRHQIIQAEESKMKFYHLSIEPLALFMAKHLFVQLPDFSSIIDFLFFPIFIKILVSINQYFNSLFFNFIQFN